MSDPTEGIRRTMVETINADPLERFELEKKYGIVYNTQELQLLFEVKGFLAPFISVKRKSDGVMGVLMFQHSPRYYFNFQKLDWLFILLLELKS